MKCARCGTTTPRLTKDQRYCPQCEHEVALLVRRDAERRQPRFGTPKDLTGALR